MNTSLRSAAAAALATSLALLAAPAGARPLVVELFTSEGCSSCPPAERLLGELASRHDLLPLAFHVTYWNALGWRDSFSTAFATQRQADYAARLGGGSYTPELVVEGRRAVVGSDRAAVLGAVEDAREEVAAAPDVRLDRAGGEVRVTIASGGRPARVLLVGYDPRHVTAIGRGENAGRTIAETNIVRSLSDVAAYSGEAMRLTIPKGAGMSAAVLLQDAAGRIVGAGY